MSKPSMSPAHPWALEVPKSSIKPAKAKFARNSKRLLRRLAAGGGWLEPREGREGAAGHFRLGNAGRAHDEAQPTVDGPTVEYWRSRGWIAATALGTYKLTAAGHAAAGLDEPSSTDAVSPHRRQHGLVGEETRSIDGGKRRVTADGAESPLGWLIRRRDRHGNPLINDVEYAAGERLRADFTIARLSQRVTASWEQTIASGASGRSGGSGDALVVGERAMDARRRVNRALAAAGPELAGILLEVCCLAGGLEAAERRLGLPQRAGKVVLQIALSRLAHHYGLAHRRRGEGARLHIRSWGAEAYRPALFGSDAE